MNADDRRIHGRSEEAQALICALLGITREEMRRQHIRRVELVVDVGEVVTLNVSRFATENGVRTAREVGEQMVIESLNRWADVTCLGDIVKRSAESA